MSATTLLHLIDAGNPTLRSIVKIANGLGMKPWELMRFVSTDYKSEISRTVTHVDNIKIITIVEKETSDEN